MFHDAHFSTRLRQNRRNAAQSVPLQPINRRNPFVDYLKIGAFIAGGLLSLSSAHAATDCSQVTEIPKTECDTLVAFYTSTGGANWTDKATNNWNVTNTPCTSWAGVICAGDRVVNITRISSNLTGTLPNLSALTQVNTLSLFDNKLSGAIPDLSALKNLLYLRLYSNQFSGTAPLWDLPNCTSVQIN